MTPIHQALLDQARAKFGEVFPCGDASSFAECFTTAMGRLLLWFDDASGSTHMVQVPLSGDGSVNQ